LTSKTGPKSTQSLADQQHLAVIRRDNAGYTW
jgi:hypothetical protein